MEQVFTDFELFLLLATPILIATAIVVAPFIAEHMLRDKKP